MAVVAVVAVASCPFLFFSILFFPILFHAFSYAAAPFLSVPLLHALVPSKFFNKNFLTSFVSSPINPNLSSQHLKL